MRVSLLLLTLGAFAASMWPRALVEAQTDLGFTIIVNRENATASASRDGVSRMFLREVQRWPNGTPVEPVDLPVASPIRVSFSRRVHQRSAQSVSSYWRQQIFSGNGLPPPEHATEAEIIRFVATHPGGIGYVRSDATNPSTVRPLQVSGL